MRILLLSLVIAATVIYVDTYSKYRKTCRDIGCMLNEMCVMKEDPCTVYSRDNCGMYPTCQKVSTTDRTCENHICPPTATCRMYRGVPQCFTDQGQPINEGRYQGGIVGSDYPVQDGYPRQNTGGYSGQTNPRPSYPGQYYAGATQLPNALTVTKHNV